MGKSEQNQVSDLKKLAKRCEKQKNRKYSTTISAQQQRVNRAVVAVKAKPGRAPKNLVKKLDELLHTTNRGTLNAFIADKIDCTIDLSGAKVRKEYGTKKNGKPALTLLNPKSTSKNFVVLSGSVQIPLDGVSWVISYGGCALLRIAKSGMEGGGFGLFAEKDYEKDECVGYYCGRMISGKQIKASNYSIKTSTNPPQVWQARREDVWMGLHFVNDPFLSNYGKTKVDSESTKYNIKIDGNLRVTAKRFIRKGTELFLHYNY